MRICAFIIFCIFINGFYCGWSEEVDSDSDESTETPTGLRELNRTSDGFCTFEQTKTQMVQVSVPYYVTEIHYARCHGHLFRRCLQERRVQKYRTENQKNETKEIVQKCCDGYTANPYTKKCAPVCVHSCIYGTCTSPNNCTCYNGYEKKPDKRSECEPKCVGCTYGACISPNICFCNKGYDWDSVLLECVPFCDGKCYHGTCVQPEECACDEGYTHHPSESVCIPHCDGGCVNGECIVTNGTGKCECSSGYQFVNGSTSECEPVCEMSCTNAKCVEPNVCECHEGYSVKNESLPHECHCGLYCVEVDGMCHCLDEGQRVGGDRLRENISSICMENNCKNGICVSPYDCECLEGFEKDENYICVAVNEICIDDPANCNGTMDTPMCSCINGVCSSNNTCVCVNGFKMSDDRSDVCEPHCTKECQNGFCINPDSCECNVGYQRGYNESEWHICQPICDTELDESNGCVNGTCIKPGVCECYEGFELDSQFNFTCIPLLPSGAMADTSASYWTFSGTLLTIVVLTSLILAGLYFYKRNFQQYNNMPKPDDEASEPIADYSNGEL